jgi:OmpA-OmpF porin, OOP family
MRVSARVDSVYARRMLMMRRVLIACTVACAVGVVGLSAAPAGAQGILDKAKDTLGDKAKETANKKIVEKVNAKLLTEGHQNQCSFKTDKDELEAGCDQKLKRLANALVEAKKQLNQGGISGYRFVVSGHTDSTGDAKHNKDLSQKRADVIAKELAARGVPANEITSVGMGSDKMLVKPDNTPAKRAKNRRYEIQVEI